MTTGRINQVTTFLKPPPSNEAGKRQRPLTSSHRNGEAFKAGSSLTQIMSIESKATHEQLSLAVLTSQWPAIETPCSPDSQISNTLPPVANEATEMAVL